ncbi:MAG: carboxypeptidase regulatory-like domain-containing protein [Acidimicrobiales bacterium]|nr:carboxypeptidase regulatory-like domain-containing protein [Acidimicrobiales bacterium]
MLAAAAAGAIVGPLLAVGSMAPTVESAGAATDEPSFTPVATFGGFGKGFAGSLQFRFPHGVDADANGDLYVVERTIGRIRHVSSAGADLTSWGSVGSGDGQFDDPRGIAVAPDGTVYVADSGNDRIQHFEADGDFLGTWGSPGSAAGHFNSPRGLAVAADGTVFVADFGNDRIQHLDADGQFLSAWGPNPGPQEIDAPIDVAVAPDGSVLVANTSADGRVQRYTSAGAFVAQWVPDDFVPMALDAGPDGRVYVAEQGLNSGAPGEVVVLTAALTDPVAFPEPSTHSSPAATREPGDLYLPSGLTVDGAGVVTVSDSDWRVGASIVARRTDHLTRFDDDGVLLARLGSADTAASPQFDRVTDVAVAPSGEQYVTDSGNHRVQRLSATGAELSHWGGPFRGTAAGEFDTPGSIAVDASGDVYVADTGNDRVQRFSSTGAFEAQWGSTGSGHGEFDGPAGVAVDPATGDVFVADSGNGRVQRFSSAGVFEAAWSGDLEDPGDLVVGAGPSVYVVDRGANRLRRFTRSGGALPLFEDRGLAEFPDSTTPGSVAVDGDGNVVVAHGDDHVDKYSRSGLFVRTYDFVTNDPSGYEHEHSAIAVDGQRRLIEYVHWEGTVGGSRDLARIDQLPGGSFVSVRAAFDDESGVVGRPLRVKVGVVNSGTTPLTGVTVSDPAAPGCEATLPMLAPGEDHVVECTVVPGAVGVVTHTATVDSDQTAPVVSEAASVEVAPSAGPVLVDEWWVNGHGPQRMSAGGEIAVDGSGDVLVADTGNDVVTRFDAGGALRAEIPFDAPTDMEVDPSGDVFVLRASASGTGVLAKFDPTGAPQWSIGAAYATGIGTGQDGRVYRITPSVQDCSGFTCTVLSEPRVHRHSSAGAAEGSFPVAGGKDVTVNDATGRVYTHGLGAAVRTYTAGGQFLGAGDGGNGSLVSDVETEAGGDVYLATYSTAPSAIKVVSPAGSLLTRWDAPASGVAVAPDGTVYVLDLDDGHVRRYGMALSGQVTDAGSGDPVPGAWALSIDPQTGRLRSATAAPDGTFAIAAGLGDRWVGYLDPTGRHTGEWFDDHALSDLAGADVVEVGAGTPTVADAALTAAGRTAAVTGTVTGSPGGAPVADVFVGVVDISTGLPAGGATTDGDGSYSVDGLGAGAHLVVFVDPSGARRFEFFDDSPTPVGSTVLDLAAGQTVTADAVLAAATPAATGSHLAGTVTGGGDPLDGGLVVALDAADFSFVRAGFTDGAGHYDLAVPPGSYRVELVDPSAAHAGEWHQDQPLTGLGSSTPVGVAPGETAVVDADLDPSGFTGAVAGTVTGPDAEAASGVWVAVLDTATFGFVAGATVDADGSYEVGGLAAGSYVVAFLDPAGGFAAEWYPDATDAGTATPVPVAAGEMATVDATLGAPA